MSTMMGRLSDWQVRAFIDLLMSSAAGDGNWVSLHFSDPSGANPEATEIPGGTYTRQAATFEIAGARVIRTTNAQSWGALAETVVTHFGIWTRPTGGHLRAVITLTTPIYVLEGGAYVLAAGELYYRWP